ncbi:MAG TPA: hypothetical protein VHF89_10590 [Solirubrobacteraceae bacterium]|nr:hypothetical protein [Solirubrobacteraceae bacterium]
MRRGPALLALLAVLPLLALLAAGCGEDPADEGPLAAAAERTANEETSRFFMVMEAATKEEGEFRMEGTGSVTADNSRGRLTATVEFEGQEPVEFEIINVRDEFWLRSEGLDLPRGKRWMYSVDRSVAPSTMTTREFLALIRESGEIEEVGGERVRGRATTHYKARVAFADVYESSPEETRERFRDRFEQFEDMELPIEVWIDGEGLVRRMDVDIARGGQEVSIRMEMLEFGVEVDTDPPPPAQVIDESEVPG